MRDKRHGRAHLHCDEMPTRVLKGAMCATKLHMRNRAACAPVFDAVLCVLAELDGQR